MTTATLPRFIAAGTGLPAYLMRTAANDATLRCYTPFLPDGSAFHWAAAEHLDPHTRAVELTVGVVAELLLVSGVNPDDTPEQLVTAVDRALSLCHCDLTLAAAVAGAYLEEHWECARGWMDRCTLAAGRLCGIEA